MPTVTSCTSCGAKYSVPDSAIGKRATCTKCRHAFVVAALPVLPTPDDGHRVGAVPAAVVAPTSPAAFSPPPMPPPAAAPKKTPQSPGTGRKNSKSPRIVPHSGNAQTVRARLTEADLAAAFLGPLERRRVPILYRLCILLAAVVMVSLVLTYLLLIVAACYVTYYHAANNTWLMQVGPIGRARIFMFLVYAAPLFAGPVLILFMIKPLFARPLRRERSRSLTRQSEPVLFAFVDQVCDAVRAPRPKRIDVDCQVNASASFRRGIVSMFGKDLVLTFGLPLMAGLTVREFGGVLAHEFAHFSQGLGMRLTYLVESIARWFARVVYERDSWDEWLEEVGSDLDFRLAWIVGLAQLGVILSRGVLRLLMSVGFVVTSFLLRQMEFDSDRRQVRFAGTDAFVSTMRKLLRLDAASQLAGAQFMEHFGDRRLVEDMPGLILLHAREMPRELAAGIETAIRDGKTGWLDSHPSMRDRVAAAEKLAAPGIFHLDRPASDLLSDFAAQAKATTWNLYLATFGPKVPRTALVPVREFAQASKSQWKPHHG